MAASTSANVDAPFVGVAGSAGAVATELATGGAGVAAAALGLALFGLGAALGACSWPSRGATVATFLLQRSNPRIPKPTMKTLAINQVGAMSFSRPGTCWMFTPPDSLPPC